MRREDQELQHQLNRLDLEADPVGRDRLLWLLDELIRWNRRINLTAVSAPKEAIEKHLVDSLTPLPLLAGDERLLDLGSGGGFPGLPLKIVSPGIQVTSVDAVGKKISFQRHVARSLRLEGFTAVHERAENLLRHPGFAEGFDVVVSRAFASLTRFASLALPCLAPGGRLLAMKGAAGEEELSEASDELGRIGFVCVEVRRLQLPASRADRTLLLFERRKR